MRTYYYRPRYPDKNCARDIYRSKYRWAITDWEGWPWSGRKTVWEPAARSSINQVVPLTTDWFSTRVWARFNIILNLINFKSVVKGVVTFYRPTSNWEMIPAGIKILLKSKRNSSTNSQTWKLTVTRSPRNFFPTSTVIMQNWGHSLRCVGIAANKISEVNQIGKKTIRSPIPALTCDILINERHDCSWLLPLLPYIHMYRLSLIWKIINHRMRRAKTSQRIISSSMSTKFLCN